MTTTHSYRMYTHCSSSFSTYDVHSVSALIGSNKPTNIIRKPMVLVEESRIGKYSGFNGDNLDRVNEMLMDEAQKAEEVRRGERERLD